LKTLISELKRDCERFTLRYQLFEEFDNEHFGKSFFSFTVKLYDNEHVETAEARDVTSCRVSAEKLLKAICSGTVTPTCLPYIIEDYLAEA